MADHQGRCGECGRYVMTVTGAESVEELRAQLAAKTGALREEMASGVRVARDYLALREVADRRLALLRQLAQTAAAWDAVLSDFCDGPERDALRAVLAELEAAELCGGAAADVGSGGGEQA